MKNDLLTPSLKRPLDPTVGAGEAAALGNLVSFLNNPSITGAEAPPSGGQWANAQQAQTPVVVAPPVAAPVSAAISKKVFFTGRLAVGKDYVASQVGAPIFGFAEPLYAIATYCFGVEVTSTKNKDLPGMRNFLQLVGQWGRADVDETYPYSPARASFCVMIRALGTQGVFDPDNNLFVDWKNFGLSPTIWSDAVVARVNAYLAANPSSRVSNTNVRFQHEYKALNEGAWEHYHIMCSPQTWAKRLASKKLVPTAPQLADKSEHMAMALDKNVTTIISREPQGKMLKVIWNDTEVPPPSPRIWTLDRFCEAVAQSDGIAAINTGE